MNSLNCFPTQQEKLELSIKSSLTISQVTNWFKTKRKRLHSNKKKMTITETYVLLKYFDNVNKKTSLLERNKMAVETGLSVMRISAWFAKQRFKMKNCSL